MVSNEIVTGQPPSPVEALTQRLIDSGARPIWDIASIADEGQSEVLLGDRRLLITPNDVLFKKYVQAMSQAGLLHLENDSELGDEEVAVTEIPRDARSITQLLPGYPPIDGYGLHDAFSQIGEHISRLEAQQGLAPTVGSLSLDKIIVVRTKADVMFTPGFALEPFADTTNRGIIDSMHKQLIPDYAKFGAAELIESLVTGLEHGTS